MTTKEFNLAEEMDSVMSAHAEAKSMLALWMLAGGKEKLPHRAAAAYLAAREIVSAFGMPPRLLETLSKAADESGAVVLDKVVREQSRTVGET